MSAHGDCWLDEPTCNAGDPATCPAQKARSGRARAKAGGWSPLVIRQEAGGLRHYLDGKPIHCGEQIELQVVEYQRDDYGDYAAFVQRGIVVRYEATFDETIRATLHADVGGHEFAARWEEWTRFRWPRGAL